MYQDETSRQCPRWLNGGFDISYSMEKQMVWNRLLFFFTFCLLQPRPRDQCECTNISLSKTQFLAERILDQKNSKYGHFLRSVV